MKRDIGLDFIRIILTMMIVVFHFCEANGLYSSKFFTMANGTWGWVATTAFILLSGFLLRKLYGNLPRIFPRKRDRLASDSVINNYIVNNQGIREVGHFYKKRLLSLFPSFYIAFLICFVIHSIYLGSPFYGGHPVKIIFSILGIDSYIGLYGISTYAVVGEWFTGLIIMLYILFPFLNELMNKYKICTTIVLLIVYISNAILQIDPTIADASVITGAFVFWCGMLLSDYQNKIKKLWFLVIPAAGLFIFLSVYQLKIPRLFITNIMGLLLFVSLLVIFSFIKKENKFTKFVCYLSGISYEVYLLHHFILYKVSAFMTGKINGGWQHSLYFIAVTLVIILAAAVTNIVSKAFIKSIKKLIEKRKGNN